MSGTGYAQIVLFDVSVDNRSLCGIWLVLRLHITALRKGWLYALNRIYVNTKYRL